jgi:hypothetical protein
MTTNEIRELTAAEIEDVTGAALRSAAPRPVPVPYPNVVAQSGGTFFGGTNEAAGERE